MARFGGQLVYNPFMEYFQILDENGNRIGKEKLRSEVHRDGDWHEAVDIWVRNKEGKILLQKRALEKESYPGLFEVSCSGHLSGDEDSRTAAVRELEEELGVKVDPQELKYLFKVKEKHVTNNGTFLNNEIKDVYLLEGDFSLEDFVLQKEELESVKFVRVDELAELLAADLTAFVPHEVLYRKSLEYFLEN